MVTSSASMWILPGYIRSRRSSYSDVTLEKAAVRAGMSEQAFFEAEKKIV